MSAAAPQLPSGLRVNPRLSTWLRFNADRTVTVATGKVEIGQGIVTAMAQIAAEELDIDLARIRMVADRSAKGAPLCGTPVPKPASYS
jgi:CO/xanthine dehydrogenase Mo-binding subunit